jgi:hypothetical protein
LYLQTQMSVVVALTWDSLIGRQPIGRYYPAAKQAVNLPVRITNQRISEPLALGPHFLVVAVSGLGNIRWAIYLVLLSARKSTARSRDIQCCGLLLVTANSHVRISSSRLEVVSQTRKQLGLTQINVAQRDVPVFELIWSLGRRSHT